MLGSQPALPLTWRRDQALDEQALAFVKTKVPADVLADIERVMVWRAPDGALLITPVANV
jgi:hypothetical protein